MRQQRLGLQQGVAGAQLRFLHCKAQAQPYFKGLRQLIRFVADDHDDRGWVERFRRP
jgi:hypothetical protein